MSSRRIYIGSEFDRWHWCKRLHRWRWCIESHGNTRSGLSHRGLRGSHKRYIIKFGDLIWHEKCSGRWRLRGKIRDIMRSLCRWENSGWIVHRWWRCVSRIYNYFCSFGEMSDRYVAQFQMMESNVLRFLVLRVTDAVYVQNCAVFYHSKHELKIYLTPFLTTIDRKNILNQDQANCLTCQKISKICEI